MDSSANVASTMAMIRRSIEKVADRDEILSFIGQLVSERDDLLKRQEHLNSLARLMEKTVSDADDMAAQIKREAKGEAEAQVKEIMAQAEQNAKQVLEEAKLVAAATESEVRTIRENADKTLRSALEDQAARWREHVKQASERLYEQMLAQAEESKRRLDAFQEEFGQVLASVKAAGGPTSAPAAEAAKERKSVFESATDESAGRESLPEAANGEAKAEASAEASGEAPASAKDAKTDEETVEIVILPPRDKQAMESIRKFLEMQDEVAAVNVEHMTDRTAIQVLLAKPFNVAEKLSGLSEVERLQTVKDGAKTKIQIVLSVTSEIERERDRLGVRANRIASKIA